MTLVVKPPLFNELKKFGADDTKMCYSCGKCVAVCTQSHEGTLLPRRTIRLIQLGLDEKLMQDMDPWLCYYCGECSTECPRGAEPGEIMMGVRRYLTARFDITGMSRRLYTSTRGTWAAIFIWFMLPIIYLAGLHVLGYAEVVTDEVKLNSFAPVEIINTTAHIYAGYLALILILGSLNMYRNLMKKEAVKAKVKFMDYVAEFWNGFKYLAFTSKWFECSDKKSRWLKHYILMVSYAAMFVIIVFFLRWFQTDEIYPIENPQRWLGYILTLGLLIGTIEPIIGRIRKKEEMHKHSHHTDWMLPVSIFLVAVTGILVHIFRYLETPWPTYITYAIHLGVTAVMLSTEVGVGKWTHIFYRPLAAYLHRVKLRAMKRDGITA